MGKYNGAVITTAGANVISQAISGTELTWTVMRSSSVALPEGTDIAALTSLTGIEQTAAITDASVYGNSTIQVSARFSNTGIDTAYLLETIGIYGRLAGGAETLIAVMTAVTPDQMPVYDADSPSAFIYNSQITVQDAETVVMTVNDTGTATVADLNRKVDLNGGDLSDTKGETFTASTASYPVISAGDTFKVMCGKIAKFCADIVKPFTKATASAAGAKGLVPAPAAGDQIAYLRGDGTWKSPVFSKTTTATGLALDAREANPNVSGSLAADVKSLNDSLAPLIQTYTPTISWTGGSGLTVDNVDFRYLRVSKNVYWVTGRFEVTSVGTPGGGLSISYPSVGSAFYSTNVGAGGVFIGTPGTDFSHAKIASLADRIQVTRTPGGDSWSTFSTGLYAIGCFVFVARE